MMHDREKSHSAIVAAKPTNGGLARCGAGGAKGGDQEERGRAKHAPDTGPGSRDTGARPRMASRKAQEEGEVHGALPPPQHRSFPGAFRYHVVVFWLRTLRRRSQKDRFTWERIKRLADDWLPQPRTLHPWPSARFAVKYSR